MVVVIFLFVDEGRHFVEADFFNHAIVKMHGRRLVAVFNRRDNRRYRNDADRKDFVLQNCVHKRAFAALKLADDRDRNLLIFKLFNQLLRSFQFAFCDFVF